MKIAVNCRYLRKHPEGIGWYIYEILKHWLSEHRDNEYHLLFDQEPEIDFPGCDYQVHVLAPQTSNILSIARWSTWSINKWLKNHKPDLFYSPDGFCPLSSPVRTVISVHDLAPLAFPEHMYLSARWFYRLFQKRMIRSAGHVITVSHFSKDEILKYTGIDPEKVSVVYNGVRDIFRPADAADISLVREKHGLDQPYFLYYGSIHPRKNVISVIRAFEKYKSQGGKHQLVISGRFAWKTEVEQNALKQSPNRQDIIHLDYLPDEELVPLISAAEALLYISTYEGFGLPVLEAMACGTLVITSEHSSMSEFSEGVVLLIDPLDINQLCSNLESIERQENKFLKLKKDAQQRIQSFGWKKTSNQMMIILESTNT